MSNVGSTTACPRVVFVSTVYVERQSEREREKERERERESRVVRRYKQRRIFSDSQHSLTVLKVKGPLFVRHSAADDSFY